MAPTMFHKNMNVSSNPMSACILMADRVLGMTPNDSVSAVLAMASPVVRYVAN